MFVFLAAGCGGSPALVATPVDESLCRIEGVADGLVVRIGEPSWFELDLSGAALEVSFPRNGPPSHARVSVREPIELVGYVSVAALPLTLLHSFRPDGLRVAAGAPIRSLRAAEGNLVGLVVLDGPTEAPDASMWVTISCGNLALTTNHEPLDPGADPPTHLVVGSEVLELAVVPGGPPATSLLLASDAEVAVRAVGAIGAWAHVVSRFEWAELDGWVAADRIAPMETTDWPGPSLGALFGPAPCPGAAAGYDYIGPARVRAGTTVSELSTPAPWGRFVQDTDATIAVRTGDGPIELVSVDGVMVVLDCTAGGRDHAILARDGVELP